MFSLNEFYLKIKLNVPETSLTYIINNSVNTE